MNNAISSNLPASFEVDWRAVVLNGSSWWNSGGTLMMWSGGNNDAGGAALHEGGHGHNQLADEYGDCEQSRVSREAAYGVNVSLMNGNSGGKVGRLDRLQPDPGYGDAGILRVRRRRDLEAQQNSMMNSLFGTNPNTSFNSVSREKIVMDIWRAVQQPYDSVEPPAGAVTNPAMLKVNVIDPAVISVDWTVDGTMVAANGGPTFSVTRRAWPPARTRSPRAPTTTRAWTSCGRCPARPSTASTGVRGRWVTPTRPSPGRSRFRSLGS